VTPATSVNLVRQFLIIHTDLLAGSAGNAYIYIYIYIYIYMHGIWPIVHWCLRGASEGSPLWPNL
jgi:hypothetical protein